MAISIRVKVMAKQFNSSVSRAMRSFSTRRTTGYAINSWRERVDSVAGSDA